MKHLRIFETNSDYQAFKVSDKFVLPNVSLVKEDNMVLYESMKLEINFIEYNFEIQMEVMQDFGSPETSIMGGYTDGDYNELYTSIINLLKQKGDKDDSYNTSYSLTKENGLYNYANLTINNYIKIDSIWWNGNDDSNHEILMTVEVPFNAAYNTVTLTPTRVITEIPIVKES